MYRADDSGSTVFCATTEAVPAGTDVVVELMCKALPNKVLLRGVVDQWRPALPRMRVRAGATVRIEKEEKPKVKFITETLEGDRAPTPKRKHARLPVALAISIEVEGREGVSNAEMKEISVTGGLIEGFTPPPVGTGVVLHLLPPGGATPIEFSARVIYHAGETGTGFKFLFREGGGSRRLRELVRRLRNDS